MRRVLVTLVVAVGLLVARQGGVAVQPADAPAFGASAAPTLADPGHILTNDEPVSDKPRGDGDDGGGGELVP